MTYETISVNVADDIATVTLNRPDRLNAFNQRMLDEFAALWPDLRGDDAVSVIVLRASGDRAFCTGVDVKEGIDRPDNPFNLRDPGEALGPKSNQVWKPMVVAVNGMAAGGAFYWLNEADIIICSDDATFFDPHLTYGMVSALEPIGLSHRVNLGDALRWALLGSDERMSPERALQIGLVTEVTPPEDLWPRADQLARTIAKKPTVAVQGTVRAIWESLDRTRSAALAGGLGYTQLGNPIGIAQVDRASTRVDWRLR